MTFCVGEFVKVLVDFTNDDVKVIFMGVALMGMLTVRDGELHVATDETFGNCNGDEEDTELEIGWIPIFVKLEISIAAT